MYEDNLAPLPQGDFSAVFFRELAAIARAFPSGEHDSTTPDHVHFWAMPEVQPHLAAICRRLLLPGSGLDGLEHLAEAVELAGQGHSCILCLNHRSTLDTPTLYALLVDAGREDLAQRIVWIAGRKLYEDPGRTWMLVKACHHVLVSPRSWMHEHHTEEELHQAHVFNIAAHRVIHDLRHEGWLFALFPTATRLRPHDASTAEAIEETDSYLKHFEYMLLGDIDGTTMPVSRDRRLTHEQPQLACVRYHFGPVESTEKWREQAAARYPDCDQRTASARAIVRDIAALGE